jgi:hypothetical protein
MAARVVVYLLMALLLVGLLVYGLAYRLVEGEPDPLGFGHVLLVLGWLFTSPVLALGSALLVVLARWQGDRLSRGERIAAHIVAALGLVPALVLLALYLGAQLRG